METKQNKGGAGASVFIGAGLLILLFIIVAAVAIFFMPKPAPALPNDTAWLAARSTMVHGSLSNEQERMLHKSVEIVSNTAEANGYRITLLAATGNPFDMRMKIKIESMDGSDLPAGMRPQHSFTSAFGKCNGYGTRALTEESGPSAEFAIYGTKDYNQWMRYAFDGDMSASLQIDSLRVTTNADTKVEAGSAPVPVEGPWTFDLRFTQDSTPVEMIDEPIAASFLVHDMSNTAEQATIDEMSARVSMRYCAASITSLAFTETTLQLTYESEEETGTWLSRPSALIVCKNGSVIRAHSNGGGGGGSSGNLEYSARYRLETPVPVEEVACVLIDNFVSIAMKN